MFFVAIGTVVAPRTIPSALPWLLLFLVRVTVGKVADVWIIARLARLHGRASQLAIGLGQIGEFSYVLGALALGGGLITKEVNAALIGAVVISIAASSILVRLIGGASAPPALPPPRLPPPPPNPGGGPPPPQGGANRGTGGGSWEGGRRGGPPPPGP